MAAAAAGAGGGLLAVSAPIYVEDIDPEDDRAVDLCLLAEDMAVALPRLKMRVDGDNEVFQQWELPEEEEEAEQMVWRGRQINQALPIPSFPLYYRGPPSFHLDEETTVQPGRHSDATAAAELHNSINIVSIKVLHSTVGYPINLYGSVFVRDGLDRKRVYLFHRDRDSAQLIQSPEESLLLTGPSRGLVLTDFFIFVFNLKMRCNQQEEDDDLEFSRGLLDYPASDSRSNLVIDELVTKASTIGLAFLPVRRVVEATIQIKPHQGCSIESFAKISAFIYGTADEILLFDSEASASAIKTGDDGIQLSRRVVSVPIHRSLKLRVDTWEPGSEAKLTRTSAAIFTPQICGKDVVCIHGPMRIIVTWSPLYISRIDYVHGMGLNLIGEF